MNLGLKDKVAMVGGASKGLGLAVAHTLAAEGARVSMMSRDADAIRLAAAQIERDTGAEVLAVAGDLQSPGAAQVWYDATEKRFGGTDLLFTNAGGPPPGPALGFADDAWHSTIELLLMSVVRLTRLVAPSMRARGGGAVLMSTSTSVKEPIPHLALSNVGRASVSALAKTLAIELGPSNIRVNSLLPGRISTDRMQQYDRFAAERASINVEEQEAKTVAAIPLGRYGRPEEYGRVAAFLLSDASSYITGVALQVDGGLIRAAL